MSWYHKDDILYRDLTQYMKRHYKIRPRIFKNSIKDGGFDFEFKVNFDVNDQEYSISVPQSEIGYQNEGSSVEKFIEIFDSSIKELYPELFL